MLTNVTVYWANRTGASSARLYRSDARRSRAERFFNIVHWTEPPRGGHFPAMEVPDIFVADVRAFLRPLR